MKIKSAFPSKPSAVLRVSGEDHADFLNNQGTIDLQGPVGFCRYTLWLDFKGRIHADSFVLKLDDQQMLLVSYSSSAALLIEKFGKHIVADDVDIVDETAQWRLITIAEGEIEMNSEEGTFVVQEAGYLFPGRRLGTGTIDFLLPVEDIPDNLSGKISNLQADELRIQAGIPLVPDDTGEGVLNPVECGLLSAVSFEKGCYLGQEVVARVHRLQRYSRRLVRVHGKGKVPEVPYYLFLEGQPVGVLTTVAPIAQGFIAIGWLKSSVKDGNISLNGRSLLVESLNPS